MNSSLSMNLNYFRKAWLKWFHSNSYTLNVNTLNQLNYLVSNGLETQVEVVDLKLLSEAIGGLYSVQLWLRIRKCNHTFVYIQTSTLLKPSQLPRKGQELRIKYKPDNLNSVLIL